jgi:hypothetical protein
VNLAHLQHGDGVAGIPRTAVASYWSGAFQSVKDFASFVIDFDQTNQG